MCCCNCNNGCCSYPYNYYGYNIPYSNYTCYYTPYNSCNAGNYGYGSGCSSLALIALYSLLCR